MSFELIRQLQYSSCSNYGDNLNKVPSRIIPLCLEDVKEDNIIYYITPRLGKEYIICNNKNKVPEPSAYFRSPNTFLKSLLYLSNINYYNNVSLPLQSDSILNGYIRTIFEEESYENVTSYKKIIQIILNNTNGTFDTDPDKNPFFSKFIKVILKKEKCNIMIVRSDDNGNFIDIVNKSEKPSYILLLHSSGLYSPYGRLHN